MGRGGHSWTKRGVLALIGIVVGAGFGALVSMLLFWAGFAPVQGRDRLTTVLPTVLVWLGLIGGLIGAFGREILDAFEQVLLPDDLDDGARRLYRLGIAFVGFAVTQYHLAAFLLDDPTDLPSFLLAARAMSNGLDFYDPEVIAGFNDGSVGNRIIFPYLYLPLYAVLLRPLAQLPLAAGHACFLFFNVLLWPLLIYLCLRLVDPPQRLRGALAALVLLVTPSYLPAIQTFHHGSPSLLVAVLVVGVLVLERDGRSRWAGLLLALAVLIKIVPVILIPYFLLRRRFRMLAWAGMAAAALLALSVVVAGVGPHLHWLTEMAPSLATGARTGTAWSPGCHPENQSLTGLFCRFLGADSPAFLQLSSVAGALVIVVTGLVLWRRKNQEHTIDALEGSLMVVAILLASTITWFHHMTLMLLPTLTLLVAGAKAGGAWKWRNSAVLVCGFLVLVVIGFEFYLDPWPFVVPNPITRTLRFQAMLVAYVALIVLLWRNATPNANADETTD